MDIIPGDTGPLYSHLVPAQPWVRIKLMFNDWWQTNYANVQLKNHYVAGRRVRVWKLQLQMVVLPEFEPSHTLILSIIRNPNPDLNLNQLPNLNHILTLLLLPCTAIVEILQNGVIDLSKTSSSV